MGIEVTGKGKKSTAKKTANAQANAAEATAQATQAIKEENKKAQASVEAEAPVEAGAVDGVEYGSKRDTISFVAALGDPSRLDITQAEKGGPKKYDPTIVGYRFVATEDVNVPDVPPDPNESFAANLFSADKTKVHQTRLVKKGEFIDLTKTEAALFISREEYSGAFTGGSIPVGARYTKKVVKNASGQPLEAEGSGATQWRVSLSASEQGQSIKDVKMIPVLSFTTNNGTGKNVRKERTIIPGFEKWSDLCTERKTGAGGAGSKGGAGSAKKSMYNKNAADFLASMFGTVTAAKKA